MGAGGGQGGEHSGTRRALAWANPGQCFGNRAHSVHSRDEPPQNSRIPREGDLAADPSHEGATGMSFDDRLPRRKAETDRPFVVNPRARARQQHWTYVVSESIRLVR